MYGIRKLLSHLVAIWLALTLLSVAAHADGPYPPIPPAQPGPGYWGPINGTPPDFPNYGWSTQPRVDWGAVRSWWQSAGQAVSQTVRQVFRTVFVPGGTGDPSEVLDYLDEWTIFGVRVTPMGALWTLQRVVPMLPVVPGGIIPVTPDGQWMTCCPPGRYCPVLPACPTS